MNVEFRNWLFITTGTLAIGSLTAISEGFISKSIDSFLPPSNKVNVFSRPRTIEFFSSKGEIIQKRGPVTREKMTSGAMPQIVKDAFISAEDRRFYKHEGVDFWSISRALMANINEKSLVEGGSTITQQLARIIFLNQDRTITRKLKEIALAFKLERNLTKEEIIEQYLNNVYLGSSAYGISDAAWVYFQKDPSELTLEEAALIAGLAPAPSLYSPLVNTNLALKRRDIVLKKMRLENFISDSELLTALSSPLNLKPAAPKFIKSKAPFFTSYVEQKLPHLLSKEQMEIGGLKIYTSIILDWQSKAREITKTQSPDNAEGAIVSIEPSTGLIRVLIGGKNYNKNQFNRATQALRSPGSTFKVFPYSAAISEGYKPEDILFDTPRCWYGYCPKNFGNKYFGEISLVNSFSNSLNTIAVDLLSKVGFKKVISIANRLGVGNERKLGHYYPLAIGAYEETVLNMTAAYAGITNRGVYHKPSPIKEIRGPDNKVIWSQRANNNKGTRALDVDVADTMNWMLKKVVSEGSGFAASMEGREVAGKTGTSEGARDLWFIGSVPQLTTGIWFGKDDNEEIKGSSGDAALAWKKFMKGIDKDLLLSDFPERPSSP
ncbi:MULTISPECIES: transglycosylase domain-containing protein [Prochlorococcus]|uniref:Membrane carboxypeptidase (Penicillin-binding protein) n=1 Tax=Prochlorococcus marinus (strain SARG / CCMP1375 / SS120) TaxID=167539 RepID=Q7VDF4_PROMA|nr:MULTISPECIES: PBP1A family penicillin-binding protein [Prochlorococcus]AAP99469.1 Membrane carboxypeptidase (penicillin-binding protein) [Prochlorococcus marinus subsp. marinus str. CCMP1375]KGG11262.1 Multimodular transpeptidase-transglycosylase [Prochlorococcus marinus str. LG]KGG21601.1 Multimodular transpeptidase-transglycosylase [Prochlorococcus marinus str. SS2]KGG23057.1 Multimodular transpeptidase-transglycosylase [Prochlorococcus marinus str. SS35]KGG33764.1 Multimodular transpepti